MAAANSYLTSYTTMIIHCSLHHLNSISSLIIDIYVLFRHSLQYNLIPLSRALYHTMGSLISAGCCDVFYAKNICYLPRYDRAHKHELIGLLNKQCHDPINHCLPFFNSWLSRIFSGYFCAWVIKLAGCRVMNGSLNWKYLKIWNPCSICQTLQGLKTEDFRFVGEISLHCDLINNSEDFSDHSIVHQKEIPK